MAGIVTGIATTISTANGIMTEIMTGIEIMTATGIKITPGGVTDALAPERF
jgi:hypothetical protein